MTRHLGHWARIWGLGREHIFGVYVVTFDTWHLAILFYLVQGIMFPSQGKVLSPGNEGSMAVIAYVSIFLQFCFICVHMQISGLLFPLFYWFNSMYKPNARVSVCTVRRPACWKELLSFNAGPQTPLEALTVDYLGWSHCTWELVIASDQALCEGAIFYYFFWEIVQDRARSCRTW